MTMKELVAQYNAAAKKAGLPEVKRFKSKEAAEQAIKDLEARKGQINWPFNGIEHKVRAGSLQGQLLEALREGATMDELEAVVVNRDIELEQEPKDDALSRAKGAMRMLHRYNGYGIFQDGETFTLVEE